MGAIARFWSPLSATWLMMALEGPFLAAMIARLPDPTINLAAHGVAFAFAVLIEAPVIMIMSASTALVEDADSYRRLRWFSHGLNVLGTLMLLTILVPPVFSAVMYGLLGLPTEVGELTRGALWLFLPWPTAIGYRRFLHGVMIRTGKTRLVAAGTVLRLGSTATTAFVLYHLGVPGALLGAASLSAGVCTEALVTRIMASGAIQSTLDAPALTPANRLYFQRIVQFYYPLALTSLIGLTAHPMLTFFMGRSRAPLESLAVFPVVSALAFVFRSFGLSYQEAAIALMGKDHENAKAVMRFAFVLGGLSTLGLALVATTPLFGVWFETISGLSPELASFARVPALLLIPLPAMSVLLSVQRATLVLGHRTRPITVATALEVVGIAVIFGTLGWGLDLVGVTAAILAFVGGRAMANAWLFRPVTQALQK